MRISHFYCVNARNCETFFFEMIIFCNLWSEIQKKIEMRELGFKIIFSDFRAALGS